MAKYLVQHRRGTAADWAAKDTLIPREGEIVIEIDEVNSLHKLKIGDGVHTYAELAYLQAGDEIVTQVLAKAMPRVVTVELTSNWSQVSDGKYGQVIELDNITKYSRLDLQPNADMLAEFKQLGLVFVTENNGGVITVYSVGDMPSTTYTMQATIVETECDGDGECIIGIPVGAPMVHMNIVDGLGTGTIQQTQDQESNVTEGYFDFTDKNENATNLEPSLTGEIEYGATGDYASSFGGKNAAIGKRSHAEGTTTIALGKYSHAEGSDSVAIGETSHVEGWKTTAYGAGAHAEGKNTLAGSAYSHAEGVNSRATNEAAHAEGYDTYANGKASHTEGNFNIADGDYAHAEGNTTRAPGLSSHSEGEETHANGRSSHAEGRNTIATGDYSHSEGNGTAAYGMYSHAEGIDNEIESLAIGAHAEGGENRIGAEYAHAEGYSGFANGRASHTEGVDNTVDSGAEGGHAEGRDNKVKGAYAHAEGSYNTVLGISAHVEGQNNTVTGNYAHASGTENTVQQAGAHAMGRGLISARENQMVMGQYNTYIADALFVFGNGKNKDEHSNAFIIQEDGSFNTNYPLYAIEFVENGTKLADKYASKEYVDEAISALENRLKAYIDSTILGGEW